jgi:thioredoxin 1
MTVLFFTATWCEPCRAVAPMLAKIVAKNPKTLKLVTIDFDKAKTEVARWGVREIPAVIALSTENKVLLRQDGADRSAVASLETNLEGLLAEVKGRK